MTTGSVPVQGAAKLGQNSVPVDPVTPTGEPTRLLTGPEFDKVEGDVLAALEAMYGAEGANDLLGDYRNQVIMGERLMNRIREDQARIQGGKAPRWEDDPVVIQNGWLEGRCTNCGQAVSS